MRIFDTEINEYAYHIGMEDPQGEDSRFLWIAKEGLKAQLPPNWKPCAAPVPSDPCTTLATPRGPHQATLA